MAFVRRALALAGPGNQSGGQWCVADGCPGVKLAFLQPLFHRLPDGCQPTVKPLQAAHFRQQAIRGYQYDMSRVPV